jgi:hypothetical protein
MVCRVSAGDGGITVAVPASNRTMMINLNPGPPAGRKAIMMDSGSHRHDEFRLLGPQLKLADPIIIVISDCRNLFMKATQQSDQNNNPDETLELEAGEIQRNPTTFSKGYSVADRAVFENEILFQHVVTSYPAILIHCTSAHVHPEWYY